MAKKPATEVTVEGNDETPEVVIVEQAAPVVQSVMSEQTRLEMEAGRAALKAHATSSRAEKGE